MEGNMWCSICKNAGDNTSEGRGRVRENSEVKERVGGERRGEGKGDRTQVDKVG